MGKATEEVRSKEISPLAGAIAITTSTFIALTSIFVVILAVFTGMQLGDSVGLTSSDRTPSENANWVAYGVAVALLINAYFAGKARANPRMATITGIVFLGLTVATWVLYLKAW